MKRDAALFFLGAWILGLLAMAAVAMQNFYTIDTLLETLPNPAFARGVEVLDSASDADGVPTARELLRYLSSELNRLFFWGWGIAEVGLGLLVVWLLWDGPQRRVRWAGVAMLVLAMVLTFGLTPPIVNVGRALDFVPRDPSPPQLATFGLYHAAYSVIDGVKLVLGLLMVFWIARGGRSS
jgi:hypothetical protein